MRRRLGVNTWVWTSPLDDDGVVRLAAHVAAMGFEVLEMPFEDVGDWDAQRAREVLAEHGLAVPRPAPASSPRWGAGGGARA